MQVNTSWWTGCHCTRLCPELWNYNIELWNYNIFQTQPAWSKSLVDILWCPTLVLVSSILTLSIEIFRSTFRSLLAFVPASLFLIWLANCKRKKEMIIIITIQIIRVKSHGWPLCDGSRGALGGSVEPPFGSLISMKNTDLNVYFCSKVPFRESTNPRSNPPSQNPGSAPAPGDYLLWKAFQGEGGSYTGRGGVTLGEGGLYIGVLSTGGVIWGVLSTGGAIHSGWNINTASWKLIQNPINIQ